MSRKFYDASLSHEYYDSFNVNSKNYMEKSKGTEAFLAEFDRLIGRCVCATAKGPCRLVREAFELLFALLRRIDEDGAHVWFFFSAPVAASTARKMGCHLITETMARRHELSMDSYDRLFPSARRTCGLPSRQTCPTTPADRTSAHS